jgi:hypothetical protein
MEIAAEAWFWVGPKATGTALTATVFEVASSDCRSAVLGRMPTCAAASSTDPRSGSGE